MKRTFSDPYCYPETTILRNHFGITDRALLDAAELRIVGLRNDQLFNTPPGSPHNLKNLLSIHKTLFGELYPFAGKLREHTGRMTKTRPNGYVVVYCDSAFVPPQIELVFNRLASENFLNGLTQQTFVERAAYFYGELDAIHPFREGTRRTLRLFFYGLAQSAGFHLDWRILGATETARNTLYAARDRAVMHGDSSHLASLFHALLSPR